MVKAPYILVILMSVFMPFQMSFAQYIAKLDSNDNLITMDSIGNIISVEPFQMVDTNVQLLYWPEKFSFTNAVDTLDALSGNELYEMDGHERKKLKVIRYVEGNIKRKVVAFDENWNAIEESWFNEEKRYYLKAKYPSGIIKSVATDNGLQKSTTEYYPSGVMRSFLLQDSSRTILNQTFDSTGIVHFSYRDLPGDSAPHMQFFYENGAVANKCHLTGRPMPFIQYYENSDIMYKGNVIGMHNMRVGKWTYYYPDGSIERECSFNDSIPNQKEGVWKWWNERGALAKKEVYKNDKLIETKEYLPKSEKIPN